MTLHLTPEFLLSGLLVTETELNNAAAVPGWRQPVPQREGGGGVNTSLHQKRI